MLLNQYIYAVEAGFIFFTGSNGKLKLTSRGQQKAQEGHGTLNLMRNKN
jgi:hypothetical protein